MKLSQLCLALMLLLSFLLISTSHAEMNMNCHTDSFGNKTCQDNNGASWFGRKDLSGNVIWTDRQGNIIREEKDSFGNTTYRDSRGKIQGKKDSFGNEEWQDKQGNMIKGRTDSFGNSNYQDSSGNKVRCYKDSLGNETCGN